MPYCKIDVYDQECNNCGNVFIKGEKIDSVIAYADVMMEDQIIAYIHEQCPKKIGKNSEKCPQCSSPNKKHCTICHECHHEFTTKCGNCGGVIKRFFGGLSELTCEHNHGDHGEE